MATGINGMDMLRMIGSLVLVFGLLGGVLWLLRRMQTVGTNGLPRRLQIVESISVGTRQKVALVRLGEREVLIGLTPTQITALGEWPAAATDKPTVQPKFSLEPDDAS